MAIDEDALNDALNTPTDELEDQRDYENPDLDLDLEDDPDELEDDPDEPEDEPDPVDELLGTKPAKKPENRVQRLANERREAEDKARAAEARAAAAEQRLREQEQGLQAQRERARQEELENMDPAERRAVEALQEARQARFAAEDSRDAQQFNTRIGSNPALKSLAADVEKELAAARSKGMYPTREAVAKFILGERALQRLEQAPAKVKAGRQRVENARGRPVGAGSDARPSKVSDKGDTPEAREKRLMGVRL